MGLLFGAVQLGGERVVRGPPHHMMAPLHPMGKYHVRKDFTAPMSQAVSLLVDVCVIFFFVSSISARSSYNLYMGLIIMNVF